MRRPPVPVRLVLSAALALPVIVATEAGAAYAAIDAATNVHIAPVSRLPQGIAPDAAQDADGPVRLAQATGTGRGGSTTTVRTSGTSTSTGVSPPQSSMPAPVQAVPPATGPAGGSVLAAPGPSALQPTVPGASPRSSTTGGTYPAGTSPSSTSPTIATTPEQSGGTTGIDMGAAGSTLKDCMAVWEPATHMSKSEWRDTCKRTLSSNFGLHQ